MSDPVWELSAAHRPTAVEMITGCGTRIEWRGPDREKLSFREGEFELLYDRRLDEAALCRTVDRLQAEGFRLLLGNQVLSGMWKEVTEDEQ